MAFQAVEASASGFTHELFFKLLAWQPEGHIHSGPAVSFGVAAIKAGSIDLVIQNPSFILVSAAGLSQPCMVLAPWHYQPHYINREGRRRVVERVFLRIGIVVHHRRQALRAPL